MKRAVLAVLGLMGLGTVARGEEVPNEVTFGQISYGGSGCPQGSVGQTVAADRKSFTMLFDDFVAEIGPGIAVADKRRNCQITVEFKFPLGWSYSIAGFDYRGYATLDDKVEGEQRTSYYFEGDAETRTFDTKLKGKYDSNYIRSDKVAAESVVWSACGASKPLNINSEVWVDNKNNPHGAGILTVDSLDAKVEQKYLLQWRRCDGTRIPGGDGTGEIPTTPDNTPSKLSIRSIAYGGTGCKQGSVGQTIASDRKSFTLLYDNFVISLGPTVSKRENRKFCQMTVDFDYPDGWTYSLVTLDYRGFAELDEGVSGLQKTSYYFQGDLGDFAFESTVKGPMTDSYQYRDNLLVDALWSPCGQKRPLNLKTDIRLSSTIPTAAGLMTVDSADGNVQHRYGLRWKPCGQ